MRRITGLRAAPGWDSDQARSASANSTGTGTPSEVNCWAMTCCNARSVVLWKKYPIKAYVPAPTSVISMTPAITYKAVSRTRRGLNTVRIQPVAHTPYGLNGIRAAGLIQLPPQIGNVDVHQRWLNIALIGPNIVQDLFA